MTDDEERSRGGSRIYRHERRERSFELATEPSERAEAVEAHVARHIGPVESVWHELVSDLIHLDVHVVPPSEERNAYTLFTTGMSDIPMAAPDPEFRFAELLITLPPTWSLDSESMKQMESYWPIHLIKYLARLPHEYETWLGPDHTVPNGDPPSEFVPGLGFAGSILFPSVSLGEAFMHVDAGDDRVHMLAVYPLYAEELQLKLDRGAEELFDRLEAEGITDVVSPGRCNVAKGPKPFGPL